MRRKPLGAPAATDKVRSHACMGPILAGVSTRASSLGLSAFSGFLPPQGGAFGGGRCPLGRLRPWRTDGGKGGSRRLFIFSPQSSRPQRAGGDPTKNDP